MCSSRHDVFQIKNYFKTLASAFSKYTKEKLHFQLIVIDYSWGSIHGILNSLNHEDPIEYAFRILRLIKGQSTEDDGLNSNLVSCAAHTMHRFTKSLGKLQLDPQIFVFFCYCFSLMLNSTTEKEIKDIFFSIGVICLTKYTNQPKQIVDILEHSLINNNYENISDLIELNGEITICNNFCDAEDICDEVRTQSDNDSVSDDQECDDINES
ncbi:unnamed protein product [Brachionus calyciflorus]|uniref:Uncharacterized protein n=1 Tax=Brachionus calyciflorus TaxID=104777 RepID=A0A814RR09_9BILA|nr:unnamed protein product [Brachionus calyciflorus]